MKDAIIIPKMVELAKMIDYEPSNIAFLQSAMYCQIIHKDGDGKIERITRMIITPL